MKTKLRKFFSIALIGLTFTTFLPQAQAGFWEDETYSICYTTIHTTGGPVTVAGVETSCKPERWSYCAAAECRAILIPEQ